MATQTQEGSGMGEESSNQPRGGRALLSSWGWVALVAAFCIVVPVAGAAAEEVGGWPGVGLWVFAWAVMAAAAVAVTLRYANPFLPTLCGVMIGALAPRPSEAWFRQLAGDGWGRALSLALSIVAIAIGMAVFTALAKRRGAAFAK